MAKNQETLNDLRIVVLQRGWIVVGDYSIDEQTQLCKLTNSSVIRNWGTTKGLGQLVAEGPTKETILDKNHGDVEYHKLTEIMNIKCNGVTWLAALKLL